MKHKHHIIPRHVGGTNDPSNIIELTVEEHARAHYILWNQHGRWQDKLAWVALSGMIGREEVMSTLYHYNGIDSPSKFTSERSREVQLKCWKNPNYSDNQLKQRKLSLPLARKAALSLESRQKRKDSFKTIGHQQGEKNSQFGKMWITNGTHSYRIDKTDSIPEGYRKGRVMNK